MSLFLLSNLTHHAHTTSKANVTAILQQIAFYTRRHKRGRDYVQFPWIWPSDVENALKRPPTPSIRLNSTWHRLLLRVSEALSDKVLSLYVFKDMFYAKKIRDTTIPLVLSRIADVINKRDYNLMDELMTPYLAKLYKHAVANMDAQGFRIKLEIDVQMPGARNDYMWIKQGDPEAFDYTIPFPIRNSKYAVGRGEKTAVAANKDKDGMVSHGASKAPIYSSWIGFEFGFVVNAHVKVDLYKGKRIIDSDSGVMPIPIAISTPHYLDMHVMANVVSAGEGSENEEPFRWRVCDLFYIADSDNANNAAQANKKKIE